MVLLRRQYTTTGDTTTLPSESTKFIQIHFSIIISVFLFIIIIGVTLYMYRRKLKKIKSLTKNLNRSNRSANITHLTNTDEGIYSSLDYYSNNFASNYDDNKSSTYPSDKIIISQLDPVHENGNENENEPELKSSESPVSAISKGNRNYFVYTKSDKVKNDINSLILSEKSVKKSNSFSNSISNSIRRSNKKSKVNFGQILSSITSPSDTIYDDEEPDTLANTTTRVIPPVSSLPSNKCIQPKEILRGTQMKESHLIRQYSDTSDATITTVTSDATDISGATITVDYDNPILEMNKESDFDLEMIKKGDWEMTKGVDLNNKIIITETKEVVLDMLPVNENDNHSNLNYSYSNLSRESNIFNKYYYIAS